MSTPPTRHLLLCAPRTAVADLAELQSAWQANGVRVHTHVFDAAIPNLSELVAQAAEPLDAAMLVASARRAPATVLTGLFAHTRLGQRVPLAWLPMRDGAGLRRFAVMAARVQRRAAAQPALALMGQWQPHYLQVTDRMRRILGQGGLPSFRWTGDAITRDHLLQAMACGLGVGLYVGHGRPVGWVGYHGVRAHHFAEPERIVETQVKAKSASRPTSKSKAQWQPGLPPVSLSPWPSEAPEKSQYLSHAPQPMGLVLSLCCRTASRRKVSLSYSEALPLMGVAAASFGAINDTLHTDNTRWAVGVCDALVNGASSVAELLLRAAPASPVALASYRLVGDPLAPLFSNSQAVRRAQRVRTYE
jgi:hypothetical protein